MHSLLQASASMICSTLNKINVVVSTKSTSAVRGAVMHCPDLLFFDRKPQGKSGAFSKLARGMDTPMMRLDDVLHNR